MFFKTSFLQWTSAINIIGICVIIILQTAWLSILTYSNHKCSAFSFVYSYHFVCMVIPWRTSLIDQFLTFVSLRIHIQFYVRMQIILMYLPKISLYFLNTGGVSLSLAFTFEQVSIFRLSNAISLV